MTRLVWVLAALCVSPALSAAWQPSLSAPGANPVGVDPVEDPLPFEGWPSNFGTDLDPESSAPLTPETMFDDDAPVNSTCPLVGLYANATAGEAYPIPIEDDYLRNMTAQVAEDIFARYGGSADALPAFGFPVCTGYKIDVFNFCVYNFNSVARGTEDGTKFTIDFRLGCEDPSQTGFESMSEEDKAISDLTSYPGYIVVSAVVAQMVDISAVTMEFVALPPTTELEIFPTFDYVL